MIRVIAGEAKGRRLKVPKGMKVRPTADRVKEALFNILAPEIPGAVFLDLFAGSGGIGIEALSRGAEKVLFVEQDPRHLRILRENLTACGFEDRARVIPGDARALLRKKAFPPCDFVFLDPPYDLPDPGELLISVGKNVTVKNFIVYEHPRRREIPGELEGLIRTRTADYGEIRLSFFEIRNRE